MGLTVKYSMGLTEHGYSMGLTVNYSMGLTVQYSMELIEQ